MLTSQPRKSSTGDEKLPESLQDEFEKNDIGDQVNRLRNALRDKSEEVDQLQTKIKLLSSSLSQAKIQLNAFLV
jgi:hypothetical protein